MSEVEKIAAGLTVKGWMDSGNRALFTVEKACGPHGFIGRCVSGSPGVICKPGYIPFTAIEPDQISAVRDALKREVGR